MTISAYETLYESSIAYGIRKALMAEQKRTDLNAEMMHLALRKKDLKAEADALKAAFQESQQKAQENRETEEKIHADDIERIVRTNEQLKTSLENLACCALEEVRPTLAPQLDLILPVCDCNS